MRVDVILFVLLSLFGVSIQLSIESNSSSLFGNTSNTLDLSPPHYYMNQMCNVQKNLKSRDAILVSPWSNRHPSSSQKCTVGLKNAIYQSYRFVVTFKEMSMYGTSSGTCRRSRLDLFNGHTVDPRERLNDDSGLCGTSKQYHYETTTSFLTMVYETSNLPYGKSQYFEAVITPFHTGTCKHDEFKCGNGNCIKDNMLCDSYNNCGDDSDEKDCAKLAIAMIVGIVIGCVVFLGIVIGIVACCCCCGWCCAACTYESF